MDMKRESFLKLLTKKFAGNITASELQEFEEGLANNAEYEQIADAILAPTAHHISSADAQLKSVWQKIEEDRQIIELAPRRTLLSHWLKFAAAIIVVGIGLIWNQYYNTAEPSDLFSFNTADQRQYKTLEDGTTICLNRNSTIQYNSDFGKNQREIYLKGEAFFDVAKNASVPLYIHTGQITIKVKGTSFNVVENSENQQVEIALIRGKIEVSNQVNKKKIDLSPKEKLIFKAGHFQVYQLDTTKQLSTTKWTLDSLVFKKEKLSDLVLLLEKKYNVNIAIKSNHLKIKRFSGVIKDEQLTEFLDALKLSYPFTYTINKKMIIIK